MKLQLSIALDFSSKNGHFAGDSESGTHSHYEEAIKQIGGVIGPYDDDNKFPVYGFGGIPKGEDKVNHCFPLNGSEEHPYIVGIDEIISVYRMKLPDI